MAAVATHLNVSARKVFQSVTLQVTVSGLPSMKLRARLAVALIKLGAWVMGTPTEIEITQPGDKTRRYEVNPGATGPIVLNKHAVPRAYSFDRRDFDHGIGQLIDVHLDGEPISRVIGYDEDRGLILRHKTDANGDVVVDLISGEIERELLQGKVEAFKRAPKTA